MFALQPAPTMGTVVAPWSGSMIDRLSSLEDMPPKDNVISMKNIPCLGVTGSGSDVGAEGITTGKAATAVLDPTTAEATATPHASTYFASTYYHLNDDECMLKEKINLIYQFDSFYHVKDMIYFHGLGDWCLLKKLVSSLGTLENYLPSCWWLGNNSS
uniref:Uncharacterized protein n=1 Tax=Glossina austeni TaxID=7395 RepID=A0A1A9UMB6_GLOAU